MTIVFRLFTLHRPNKIFNNIQPDNIKLSLKQILNQYLLQYFLLILSDIFKKLGLNDESKMKINRADLQSLEINLINITYYLHIFT